MGSGDLMSMKGDVWAKKGIRRVLFELKTRHNTFQRIYVLMDTVYPNQTAAISYEDGTLVRISYNVDHVLEVNPDLIYFPALGIRANFRKYGPTLNKIKNMKSLLGEANILVIKDDHKRFLFLRYD